MKKTFTFLKAITLLLCMSLSAAVDAQTLGCKTNLTAFTTRPFTYLISGTRVTDIESYCGAKSGIPLGFNFRFGACGGPTTANYNTIQVSSKGWIKFGAALSNCRQDPNSKDVFPGLWPYYGWYTSGAFGTATYETETLPSGTKVFTMEWRDWRWGGEATLATYYGISYQVKLYEGSNIIEYCYKQEGSSSTAPAVVPYQIGMGITAPTATIYPSPCGPGYDFFQMKDPITPPIIVRNGIFGPGLNDRPDNNQVLQYYQACCGKPSAGFITQPDSVCPCAPFVAKLSGATPSPFVNYGVRYQWQSSADGTAASWSNIAGADQTSLYFAGICASADTFLRVIVTCDSSGMSDTTPIKHITLIKDPNNCYCYSAAQKDDNLIRVNIGNVKLITKGRDTLINNIDSGGYPAFINKRVFRPYTLYTALSPMAQLNRDSTYRFSVMGITKDTFAFSASGVALYIDYNKDGLFTASSELAAFQVISGTTTNFITNITIPSYAELDKKLGFRVVMKKGATIASDVPPCGGYDEGETEDYLITVVNPKCGGPLSAGKAYITDTSICDGYTTTVWDTAHAKNMSGMNYRWEYSLDNVNWGDVTGGLSKDTIQPVVRQSTHYRLRMICEFTKDTIYSNQVYIKLKQPYKCYCRSLAANGDFTQAASDSSDISAFILGKFTYNTGGPHLSNPEAIRMRTDNTQMDAIELVAGDTYPVAVFHTLRTRNHSDARISIFMDFNHNLKYDGISELIWTKVSTFSDFYPHDNITIPAAVIPNVETGMRVLLNNDLGASNPNDIGCDPFTSGEVEDYLVIFRRKTTGIGDITNVDNLQIYPNPNNGQFTVSFNASKSIAEATVSVTNITGQQVYAEHYSNINNSFVRNINLGTQAPGVYFITIVADGQKSVNKLIVR